MAVYSGPEIQNNGLVFHYDMSNTTKSWKGAPTTNLATTQTLVNHSLVTLPTFSDAPERGVGWKKVIVTATSSNFRMLKMDFFSVAANSTTTYSIEFECNSPEVYLNIDGTGFGGGAWTKIGPTRYSRTVTTATAGSAYLFINSNNLNATVNYIIYYKEYQIEANSFATPYVSGTRSNTQSIVDLTNNTTVTATSLTYASDGTFSFNGGTESAYINSVGPIANNFSISAWINSTSISVDQNILSMNGPYFMRISNSRVRFNVLAGGTWLFQNGTTVLQSNTWYYFTMVYNYDTSQWIGYINGRQEFAVSKSGTIANSSFYGYIGYTPQGGEQSNFFGKIAKVEYYNRALSAAEVKQNFEAVRGRYGI